jgi:DNA-binding CsgD family transcriptional regulator/tetratricopeptide (TPR) repeat protein
VTGLFDASEHRSSQLDGDEPAQWRGFAPPPGSRDRDPDDVEAVRGAEFAALRRALDTPGPAGRVVVLTGGPGSGKTHLVSALVRDRSRTAASVAVHRFTADSGPGVVAELAGGLDRPRLGPGSGRRRLLVLDDVHLADCEAVAVLAGVISGELRPALDVVLAVRPRQMPSELAEAVRLGTVFGNATNIELGPLPDEGLLALGGRLPHGPAAPELRRRSGGSPFNLGALLALQHAEQGGDITALAAYDFSVARETRGLTPVERTVLNAAAVLRGRFDVGLVAAVSDLDVLDVAEAIGALVRRDLVRPDNSSGLYAVRDRVFAELLHRRVDPHWADQAHRRAARILAERGLSDQEIGFHLLNSSRGSPDELDRLVRAAEDMLHTNVVEAVTWLNRVIAEISENTPTGLRARVLLARALALGGRLADSRELLFQVLEHRAQADPTALADLVAFIAIAEGTLSRDEQTLPVLAEFLADPELRGTSAWPRLVLADGCRQAMVGDVAPVELTEDALAAARDRLDHATVVGLLAVLALGWIVGGEVDAAVGAVRTGAEVLARCPERALSQRLEAPFLLGLADVFLGWYSQAHTHLQRGVDLSNRFQQPYLLPSMLVLLSEAQRHLGMLAEARTSAERAITDGGQVSALRHSQAVALQSLSEVWLEPVGTERAKTLAREALAGQAATSANVNGSASIAALALAMTAWLTGDPQHCVTLLLNEGRGSDLRAIPIAQRAKTWEVLCVAGLDAGLPLSEWADRCAELARRIPLDCYIAYSRLTAGHQHRAEGAAAEAARSYLDGAQRFMKLGMAVEQAYALGLAAGALGTAGDVEQARTRTKLAVEIAQRSQARTLVHWLDRDAAAARRGREVDDGSPLRGLTQREREVAELIGSGMRRKEVAARLAISTRTVDVHLTRIYRKTGVSSKTELALALQAHDSR